jgi:hypothetical protein
LGQRLDLRLKSLLYSWPHSCAYAVRCVATVTGGGAGSGVCVASLQPVEKVQTAKAIHQACRDSFVAEDLMLISDAFIYSLPMDQKNFSGVPFQEN